MKAQNKSKVTNGRKMVAGVDGRSADARRYKDLVRSYADDIGGPASLSEAQKALVSQAAILTLQAERMQGAALRGEIVDIEQQTRLANVLGRSLTKLGIKRDARAKPKSLVLALAEAAR